MLHGHGDGGGCLGLTIEKNVVPKVPHLERGVGLCLIQGFLNPCSIHREVALFDSVNICMVLLLSWLKNIIDTTNRYCNVKITNI